MTPALRQLWQQHNSVFVTGTDTEIGKTHVSAQLIHQLATDGKKVVGIKPIASGFYQLDGHGDKGEWVNDDVLALRGASNVEVDGRVQNRYAFQPAIAPHIAANMHQVQIDFKQIAADLKCCQQQADYVVMEGVGGWRVPLSGYQQPDQDVASLVALLDLPVVLVVGIRLGCINHAVLTAEAITYGGATLCGWVANHLSPSDSVSAANVDTITRLLDVPLLAEFPYLQEK